MFQHSYGWIVSLISWSTNPPPFFWPAFRFGARHHCLSVMLAAKQQRPYVIHYVYKRDETAGIKCLKLVRILMLWLWNERLGIWWIVLVFLVRYARPSSCQAIKGFQSSCIVMQSSHSVSSFSSCLSFCYFLNRYLASYHCQISAVFIWVGGLKLKASGCYRASWPQGFFEEHN